MSDPRHRWDYEPHVHSNPGCKWPRCGQPADGSLDGEPYCARHADYAIERWVAISEYPDAARLLPALYDEL